MLGLALWLLRTQALYQPYRLWQALERPDWPLIRTFARLGLPGGLAILVEVTSFTLMALFIARLGTVPLASHQIAANLAAVLYMVPLSLGIATSSRTSYWLGAANPRQARHTVLTGLKMTLAAALGLSGLLWLTREAIASAYASHLEVIDMASTLLAWVALYHLFDAVQAVCVFVLRCYRITLLPLLVYGVLLWGVGLGGGYGLAYWTVLPAPWPAPASFWATGTLALALTALLFSLLLRRVMVQKTP
jgi:MATE family multidrug resistance protein